MEYKLRKTMLALLTIVMLVVLCVGYYAAMGGQAAIFTSTAERKLPIYCVDTTEKKIAISFDAAWGNEFTDDILNILDEYQARATFFLVGFWIDKFPDDVKEIQKRGMEIGSHSMTHPDMTTIGTDQIDKELDENAAKIKELIGKEPKLFRCPYGAYDNTFMEIAESKGYKVIQWDVDSLDWKDISTEQIVERVVRNVKNGSIVLFHNNAQYVAQYLPQILQKLKADGYEIVPVGELIMYENYYMDHTGKQCKDDSAMNETPQSQGGTTTEQSQGGTAAEPSQSSAAAEQSQGSTAAEQSQGSTAAEQNGAAQDGGQSGTENQTNGEGNQ